MSLNPTRREVLIGAAAVATAITLAGLPDLPPRKIHPRISPKFQAALDQLSKQSSTLSPELEAYLERTEGWIDRALSGSAP
jgi:hypothetical protein